MDERLKKDFIGWAEGVFDKKKVSYSSSLNSYHATAFRDEIIVFCRLESNKALLLDRKGSNKTSHWLDHYNPETLNLLVKYL